VNLKEWLNHRKNCPICEHPLTIYLHSQRRQSIKFENDRMIVIFPLTPIKNHKSVKYKIGYSFSLTTPEYYIEFYDQNLFPLKSVPFSIIKKFKELNKNLGLYGFLKMCNQCQRYVCQSSSFVFSQNGTLEINNPPFGIVSEYFGFLQTYGGAQDNRHYVYRLFNIYGQFPSSPNSNGSSFLDYWITNDISDAQHDVIIPPDDRKNHLQLPLIPFVNHDDTLQRIKKLIIFS
jgi:hypothetical protein